MELTSYTGGFSSLAARIGQNETKVSRSVMQLSSGNRINRASDDVAGLSISTSLQTRTTSLRASLLNLSQADSLLQVADGAMAEQETILQRMNALSVQANSGGLRDTERMFLDQELQELKKEMDRLANETNFGGVNLLNSEFDPALAGVYTLGGADITGNEVRGTNDAEVFTGTTGNDSISSLLGNDVLLGGAGNDTLNGGFNKNTIDGGIGDDFVIQSLPIIDEDDSLPVTVDLVAHMDASFEDNVASAGDDFIGFDDLSVENNDMTNVFGNVQTGVESIGGLNSFSFNGDDVIGIGNSPLLNTTANTPERTIMIAFRTGDDVNSRQVLYEQGAHVNGFNFYIDSGDLYVGAYKSNGTAFNYHLNTPIQANTTYVVGMVFDNTTTNTISAYINGTNYATSALTQNQNANPGEIAIGAMRNRTRFFDFAAPAAPATDYGFTGQIGELVNYDAALNAADALTVQNYLVNKWAGSEGALGTYTGGEGNDTLAFDTGQTKLTLDGSSINSFETIDLTAADVNHRIEVEESYFDDLESRELVIDAGSNTRDLTFIAEKAGDNAAITVIGGEGNDTIRGDDETNIHISYEAAGTAVNVDLFNGIAKGDGVDTLSDINIATGSNSHDTITGGNGDNTINGGQGDDLITDQEQKTGRLVTDGLVHYLDGSNTSSIAGSPITTITDSSSNGTDALDDQGNTFSGIDEINGINSITFDGTNFLRIADSALINTAALNERSIFTTFETSSDIAARQVIYEQGNATNGFNIYIENERIFMSAYRGTTVNVLTSAKIEANTAYSAGFVFDSSGTGTFKGYLNGEQVGELSNAINIPGGGAIGIGGMNGDSQFNTQDGTGDGFEFEGEIGEVLIYNSVIAGDDLTDLNDFLANRRLNLGGDDSLSGGEGNDTLLGGVGDDTIDGGTGDDVAVFSGRTSDYTVDYMGDGKVRVTDRRADGTDGSDVISNVETLQFSDGKRSVLTLLDEAGDISFQVQESADQRLSIELPNTTIARLFEDTGFNILTQEAAEATFNAVKTALDILTAARANIGASQSSVDILTDVNSSALQNQSAARAVITDTDVASASTDLAQNLTRSQLSINVATQTNQLQETIILDLINNGLVSIL